MASTASPLTREVGAIVVAALTDRSVTLAGLAQQTGIPRSTLRRSLDGLRPFTVDELAAVAPLIGYRSPVTLLRAAEKASA